MSASARPSPAPDFRTFFEAVPGRYLVLKPDFTIVAVTEAYLRATRMERSAALGRSIFDVFPANLQPGDGLRAALNKVMQSRMVQTVPAQKYGVRLSLALGGGVEEHCWILHNAPVLASNGEVMYVIQDLEDASKPGRELPTPQEAVEGATQLGAEPGQRLQSMTRLAAGVTHDFNNLVGVIVACAQLIEENSDPELARRLVKQIRQATEKAASSAAPDSLAHKLRELLK